MQRIEKSVLINATPSVVWDVLTFPERMKLWMGDPDMKVEILTDWKVGSPVVISGFHHTKFENRGVVLQSDPKQLLRYTHLSSLSRLPDVPESYSIMEFRMIRKENQTSLVLAIENFPTESIRKHLDFYWTTTLEIIKKTAEQLVEG